MKHGHPFETEQFDSLRAAQRRLLRSVPDTILSQEVLGLPYRDRSHDADAAFIESTMRDRAADLAEKIQDLLAEWSGVTATDRLGGFLSTEVDEKGYSQLLAETQGQLARDASRDRKETGDIPSERRTEVAHLLYLLQMADQLASDGYRDPRVRVRESHRY